MKKSKAPTNDIESKTDLTSSTVSKEPEVVGNKLWMRIRRRIEKGKSSIDEFIGRRAVQFDLNPEPIIESFWQIVLLLPRLAKLVGKLLIDSRVPLKMRLKCGLALTYVISPIDLIGEALLGPIGLIDDIVVFMIVLDVMLNRIDKQVLLDNWSGSPEVLDMVAKSVGTVGMFVPAAVYKRVLDFFGGKITA